MRIIIMSRRERTPKQHVILEAIQGRTDHPTAEELYRELNEHGHAISLATVYRNLRALTQEGKVRELHGAGPDRFDPTVSPHYHFRCHRCGRIYDLDLPYRRELDSLNLGLGFKVLGHQLIFLGLCQNCQGEKEEPWQK
ncbi:Peroxide operon regulator, Peroxide-responsive repressor PerR [Candidatus Bipolaricaulis anaerobius]|uniref:Peroxide operon regulator, Peroxide-responsive repressor PerR n=2 Tax=Candidatus Bipolaricaulis anaerobius TaxID=2026885 RepID=A0A2X3K8D4_9BACT|nr:Peroxide operon regulator, Peroxide-responsive repressor PerR [Candidatus Bipolaricaulis anaerobius]